MTVGSPKQKPDYPPGIITNSISSKTSEYVLLVRTLTLLAFGTTGCVFLQFLLVTAELYPTAIRNLANSHINVCGRLGNVFGPLAFSLPVSITGFPYLMMAALGFLDVLLFQIALPESKGVPLPSGMPAKSKMVENEKLLNSA
ncbi:unnamed protein product [Heligmosomoides polygyrus]|uniref:MFS domain-containing protein n=1 Tax=Heligmosomoides polygyrus TaxID=6339 RepID=A0A183GM71_HELPZ|nr:unnamed protein product [Heligmosomoides polygyrus]